MEVISSITEYKKGDAIPRHIHHGIEAGYVVQGTTVQIRGKGAVMVKTGEPVLYLRDVPHGGITVVGDRPLKVFTVHIVDQGKPLYDWVK
jgi:quercetin dioxygenase-like cupin family protein